MSNIYIHEPPTNGKVLLKTTAGDIDIELWSKEAPKACRNFIQLCMEGYYDGTIFHRVVPGFIVQGGDPTGTGSGGESIYGRPFKDELHSRLRFNRRGLVAMANAGPHDNGSQFFFTLGRADELNNKHTIFGKITGDTVYNMLRLSEVEVDKDDRPVNPHRIRHCEILYNPFEDIIPRSNRRHKRDKKEEEIKKFQSKGTKNFSLLSFGEEAEEEEEEVNRVSQSMKGKSKSSHDLLKDDPRLSSIPVVESDQVTKKTKRESDEEDSYEPDSEDKDKISELVAKKLKKEKPEETKIIIKEEEKERDKEKEREKDTEKKPSRSEELRKEARQLKRELLAAQQKKEENVKVDAEAVVATSAAALEVAAASTTTTEAPVVAAADEKEEEKEEEAAAEEENDTGEKEKAPLSAIEEYFHERKKYEEVKKHSLKKGTSREEQTLALLDRFKSKLVQAITEIPPKEADEVDTENDEGWLSHVLQFEDQSRKVKDAAMQDEDTFEIYDPRNPVNKRRREESKKIMKEKKEKR
ncbi:spliceosome-associated protein CWC27 homolog [Protopterus annectens]|uniref:spliceosome-associated protein CWC27 homolog n=1 Tax=Protopterus annectens TaxID=7888 RepID=UPI001CFA6EE3|nr:spliceosome-associated protein CWC27 homolog [Protopterus annectens]